MPTALLVITPLLLSAPVKVPWVDHLGLPLALLTVVGWGCITIQNHLPNATNRIIIILVILIFIVTFEFAMLNMKSKQHWSQYIKEFDWGLRG